MKRRGWAGVLFIAPALTLLVTFYIAPILYSLRLSFYKVYWTSAEWAGLDNFIRLIREGLYWDSIRVSAKFLVAILFCDLVISYLIALGLTRINKRIATSFRACYYIPVILSSLVTVSVWRWFLRYGGGAFNTILEGLHLPAVMWLGHPTVAPWALCLIVAGGAIGTSVILYAAALGQLNTELLDAARVDGANEIQIVWHIITPLVRPTMLYILVINTIGAFQIWETPFLFTEGGPLHSTSTVALTIFNTAFGKNDYGLASAMTIVTTLGTLFLAWIFIKKMNFGEA